MNHKKALAAIKAAKEARKERKFSESYDLVINLKNLNVKSNPVKVAVVMPHTTGRSIKVCAFVGQELAEQSKKFCDKTITDFEFASWKGKIKEIKKLAEEYDFFIAQATVMAKMAGTFGKTLGMKGKMPHPKAGQVVPPNANLQQLVERLGKTVSVVARKATNLQCIVGKDSMSDDEVAENIETVYKTVVKALPNEEQNVKKVLLKLTMGKPVIL